MLSVQTEKRAAHGCWICGDVNAVPWKSRSIERPLVPQDFQITDARYGITLALKKCRVCGFVFADDEEVNELESLYERLSDPAYEEGQESRALQMRWLLECGAAANRGAATLLDIGAGAGLLVAEARRRGLDATGVEPSRSLVNSAPRVNGVELVHGIYPHRELAGRRFDLVFLVDVIEHVSDPVQLLRDCARALNPGGVFIVVTPDLASVAARFLGKRWWHLRLAHVGYFNRRNFERAAASAGLVPLKTMRARWYFPVHYLADRVAKYLPIGAVNRVAPRIPGLRWIYNRVIPLNLRDSLVFVLKPSEDKPGGHK